MGESRSIRLAIEFSHKSRWHADIKPDNILRVKGRFKLADPGFAKFKKSEAIEKLEDQTKRLRDQTTMIHGGTRTYGKQDSRSPTPRDVIQGLFFQALQSVTQDQVNKFTFLGRLTYGPWAVCSR